MTGRAFTRIAVVNRGEAAMRLIHAAREWREERDEQLEVVALYTDPEQRALFVREADDAVRIGPATFTDPRDGERKNGYLDYEAIERALVAARADAVWVGWGFVAEHPEFAALCERLGVVFVGPDAAVMRTLGDKIRAKLLAEEVEVPVAPWSRGPVETLEEARAQAGGIGFPLMIKASAGGGGRGIRRVDAPDQLDQAFGAARSEALKAFGASTVFLERLVERARHIEVQVVADGLGGVWSVGVRDCTVQRRHQKVLEESSSLVLTPAQEQEVRDGAARLVRRAGYRNAATVEFLYQPDEKTFSFMEVNARLQVEHPVTEMTTGIDLVKLQLHVAAGGRIEGKPPATEGHAIEVRINAEDPDRGFAPAPGTIDLLRLPTGPGLRIDTGFAEGDPIPAEFDSMIVKLIAWGRGREEALARLHRGLTETTIVVEGGTTNQGFLLGLLERPEIRSGELDNTWLDRLAARGEATPHRHAAVAVLVAAIDAYDHEDGIEQARFLGWARRGRPQASAAVGRVVDLRHAGAAVRCVVRAVGTDRYRVTIDGIAVDMALDRLSSFESRVDVGGHRHRVVSARHGGGHVVEVDGVPHLVSREDGGVVRAPAPAVVIALLATPGQTVEAGDTLAILESMKMELSLSAPTAGVVREVLIGTNVQVDAGTPLLRVEPLREDQHDQPARPLEVSELVRATTSAAELGDRCRTNLAELESLVLGFDVADEEARAALGDQGDACEALRADEPELLEGEYRILRAFADLRALFRARHDPGAGQDEQVRSPQEHLYAFLRSFDVEAEGIPGWFVTRLRAAVAHYGLEDLERSPGLEAALFRIFRSQQRIEPQLEVVMTILDRHLDRTDELAPSADPSLHEVLDLLVDATQHRYPVVADLARDVRFRYFDAPLLERAQDEMYEAAEDQLGALEDEPETPDRADRIAALVQCSQPLAPLLMSRLVDAAPAFRRLVLEVITRRYYRMRTLERFSSTSRAGREVFAAQYEHEGDRFHVVSTHLDLPDLRAAVEAAAEAVDDVAPGDRVVVDLYARGAPGARDSASLSKELAETLQSVEFPHPVRRFVVAVLRPGRGFGMDAVEHFTFRPGPDGLVEDETLRGLHPMMAKRLEIRRFENFVLERLPSVRDLYLFHGVARENPRDERLFAVAEVRDLTAVRDEHGEIVAIPELERMLRESLEAIRHVQAHRPANRRLQWNRVFLYVWPPVEFDRSQLLAVARDLAPATRGLGIEALLVRCRLREQPDGPLRPRGLRITNPAGTGLVMDIDDPPTEPLRPLDEYTQRVVQSRRRGAVYPYELVRLLAPREARADVPAGEFVEYDLDDEGSRLVPVDRPPGRNAAGIIAGVTTSVTERYPEGMSRVTILGDPTRALGSIAEPECRRIIAALDVAEERGVPMEWFALSAGAKIAMDSGSENMDWVAAVLRRLIEFTQRGGEVNVVVMGINVGAQPYWNAEATMLMHTKGILVMTPDSAMVLTGKQALDYSGGVSADDNDGIGGYERIMGPNGQAQYWAPHVESAVSILYRHYDHSYVAPGERFPRPAATDDPAERDPGLVPHSLDASDLRSVGEIFSASTNPERKKPFDIRTVMRATIDQDHPPLERWAAMRDAETAVVWDAHLGGHPLTLIGIESHALRRHGSVPADGPDQWTAGTLFPLSSKKVARAINATSGRRPLVVLANLSGFDGSPESMRSLQLEYGAEIGRAVVNFDGPIVFCVVSRFHGGAFVVFSRRLNDSLETIALEGSRASVIGGAPAAAVVFAHEVDRRTREDPRVRALEEQMAAAEPVERSRLRGELAEVRESVRSEKLGGLAAEFDSIHSVERALKVGSVDRIISPGALRHDLIDAVERGMQRATLRP